MGMPLVHFTYAHTHAWSLSNVSNLEGTKQPFKKKRKRKEKSIRGPPPTRHTPWKFETNLNLHLRIHSRQISNLSLCVICCALKLNLSYYLSFTHTVGRWGPPYQWSAVRLRGVGMPNFWLLCFWTPMLKMNWDLNKLLWAYINHFHRFTKPLAMTMNVFLAWMATKRHSSGRLRPLPLAWVFM